MSRSLPRLHAGSLCIVLHTHLPWLAHHGTWPVGEEWLHQAWSESYLPLVEMLHRLGEAGHRDLLSLGITPVLAAQLDDPYCLREHEVWLGRWQLRAEELAAERDPHLRDVAAWEFRAAADALDVFGRRWRHGGSAALRPLVDAGVVEHLGGPATHPLLPLLPDAAAGFALRTGLDDAALRLGGRPTGVWLPECAYAPGLEQLLDAHGIEHLMLDEPTLAAGGARLGRPWRLADSPVTVVGRDLALTDRVWSSRSGYPRGAAYRDFHARDPRSGFQAFRVTDASSADKQPYEPAAGAERARRDAADFVTVVREHLLAAADDGSGLAVVAWDTELFGHWWHEGVVFLEHVLRMMPEAGVRLRTLRGAVAEAATVEPVTLPAGSWGSGKDFRLWSGDAVQDLATEVDCCVRRLVAITARHARPGARDPVLDQLARQTLLAASSDWTFMVSRDSAGQYARDRLAGHLDAARVLADLVEALGADDERTRAEARGQSRADRPFGALDTRLLAT